MSAPLWQEAKSPDGRTYYYNTVTKATQWTKPEDLLSPQEVCMAGVVLLNRLLTFSQRALARQPWKEFTTPEGRKYWNNSQTRQSVWEMPAEYKDALDQNVPPPRPAAP